MATDDIDPAILAAAKAAEATIPANGAQTAGKHRRPPPRRGNGRGKPPPTSAAPAAVAAPSVTGAPAAPLPPVEIDPPGVTDNGPLDTRDAVIVWPMVLAKALAAGYPITAIGLTIRRTPTGPIKGNPEYLEPVAAEAVAGNDTMSPGEMLYDYILNYFHLTYGGPAHYHIQFHERGSNRGHIRGTCELNLGHPKQILEQRRVGEEYLQRRSYTPPGSHIHPLGWPPRGPQGPSSMGGYPPPQAGYPSGSYPPTYYPPPQPSAQDMAKLQQLAGESGYYRGLLEAIEKGYAPNPYAQQPPPPPAPAAPAVNPNAPPPGVTAAEWEEIQISRQARGFTKALLAMGFTPQGIQAGGATAASAAVALQPPPPPQSPIDAAKQFFSTFAEFDKLKKGFLEMVAPEAAEAATAAAGDDETAMKPILGGVVKADPANPESEPMRYGAKLEDETWPEYLIRWYTHNPTAGQRIVAEAMKRLDPAALGRFMERIAQIAASKQPAQPQAPVVEPPAIQAPPVARGWAPKGS